MSISRTLLFNKSWERSFGEKGASETDNGNHEEERRHVSPGCSFGLIVAKYSRFIPNHRWKKFLVRMKSMPS